MSGPPYAYLGTLQFPLQHLKQSALSARVTRSLGPLAHSGLGPGYRFTYRRGLRTDACLEELDDQEVQLWKKERSCAGRFSDGGTYGATARHTLPRVRSRFTVTAWPPYLMRSRTRSWTRCPPSRPIRSIFYSLTNDDGTSGLRLVAPR